MKRFLLLALWFTLCLAAWAAPPAQAQDYVLSIHGVNISGPEGFEMKGYAEAAAEQLSGLSVSLDLFPSINTRVFFLNSTAFSLQLTVALKDERNNNIERFFLDFSSMVNYIAAAGGVFGLRDIDDVTFENEIVVEGQSWTVITVLSKSIEGGAHYTMTSSLLPAEQGPAPAALFSPGVVGLGVLRRNLP